MTHDSELDTLLIAYLTGAITERELAELESRLMREPEARMRFAELSEQEMVLQQTLRAARMVKTGGAGVQPVKGGAGLAADAGVQAGAEVQPAGRPRRRSSKIIRKRRSSKRITPAARASSADEPATPAVPSASDAAKETGVHPDIQFGPGIGRGSSSSQRIHVRRRRGGSVSRNNAFRLPALIAAGGLVAITLFVFLSSSKPRPLLQRSHQAAAHAAEKKYAQAQQELDARAMAARAAREAFARAEAERKALAERLAQIEQEKKQLAQAQARHPAPGTQEPGAKNPERIAARKKLALDLTRKEAERKKLAEALAQKERQRRAQALAVAHAERARKEQAQEVAHLKKRAEQIGQVVFVVNLHADEGPRPVLVRGTGSDAKRITLTKGMALLAGDHIETSPARGNSEIRNPKSETKRSEIRKKSPKSETVSPSGKPKSQSPGAKSQSPRPVYAALELWGGATVDLADETVFETINYETAKLKEGRIYAELDTPDRTRGAPERAGGTLRFKTDFADVEGAVGNLDLSADAAQARLRVGKGYAFFVNAHGKRTVRQQRESVAKKDTIPSAPSVILASAVWRGRRGTVRAKRNVFLAAIIQPKLPPKVDLVKNARHIFGLVARAAGAGAKLVLLPEWTFHPFLGKESPTANLVQALDGPLCQAVASSAARLKIYLAVGVYVKGKGNRVYNSTLLYDPRGRMILRQDKNVLASRERGFAAAGQGFTSVQTALGKIGILNSKDIYSGKGIAEVSGQKIGLLLAPSCDGNVKRYYQALSKAASTQKIPALFANGFNNPAGMSAAFLPDGTVKKSKLGEDIILVKLKK